MKICERCQKDQPIEAFRQKTSGDLKGYVFPVCITCEGEKHLEKQVKELRAKGFDVSDVDAERKARAEADATKAEAAAVEVRK